MEARAVDYERIARDIAEALAAETTGGDGQGAAETAGGDERGAEGPTGRGGGDPRGRRRPLGNLPPSRRGPFRASLAAGDFERVWAAICAYGLWAPASIAEAIALAVETPRGVPLAQWLCAHCGVGAEDLRAAGALRAACRARRPEAVAWLLAACAYTPQELEALYWWRPAAAPGGAPGH